MSTSRRPTPRPTYDGPAIIGRHQTAHHVWGELGSGVVTDRVYVSTADLHVLEFELAPGGSFRHSAMNPTVFAADVCYCVLEGELTIADPEHGEVRLVRAGETVLFRRDTWHHGFNRGQAAVRVLEFFAPPPSRGTASDYAHKQPLLDTSVYRDQRWGMRWPESAEEARAAQRLFVITEQDRLLEFAQDQPSHLVGVIADTQYLRVWAGTVTAGHIEDFTAITEETMVLVTDGELWLDADAADGTRCVGALRPGDAAFLPAGCEARMLVRTGPLARYLAGAGRHLSDDWTP
jgi:uncharacterized cupin superfamily protein